MKYDRSNAQNRFAQRTLSDFSGALFTLLERKRFEDISTRELCEACNYPRATFYNYFRDIYDLLDYCWQTVSREVHQTDLSLLPEQLHTQALFERLYDVLDAERERIARILRHNPPDGAMVESMRRFLRAEITQLMLACPYAAQYPVPFELTAAHYANTIQLVLEWCFLRRPPLPKAQAQQYIAFLLGTLEDTKQ